MSDEPDEPETKNLVSFRGGVWEIVRYVHNPDTDLRPSWGWGGDPPRSSYNLRYRFGPIDLERCVYIEGVFSDQFEPLSEMEVLAIASLDNSS